jgi:hypothetical protein
LIILWMLLILGERALGDLEAIGDTLAFQYEESYRVWQDAETGLQAALGNRLPSPADLYGGQASEEEGPRLLLPNLIVGATWNLLLLAGFLLTVVVFSLYYSADRNRVEHLLLLLMPPQRRTQARHIWRRAEWRLGEYTRIQVVRTAGITAIVGFGYWLLGIQYSGALAAWTGVVQLFPVLGLPLAAIPAALVGFSQSILLGIAALALVSATFFFVDNTVKKRMNDKWKTSNVLTWLLFLPLVQSYGIIGLVVAPLASVGIQAVASEMYIIYVQSRTPVRQFPSISERFDRLTQSIDEGQEPADSSARQLIARLGNLLVEVQSVERE